MTGDLILRSATVVRSITSLLNSIKVASRKAGSTASAKTPREVDLANYLMALYRASGVELPTLVTAFVYLRQFKLTHPEVRASAGTRQRLALTALVIAQKFIYDKALTNAAWVRLAGDDVTLEDLNTMEIELLSYLNYDLYIGRDEYDDVVDALLRVQMADKDTTLCPSPTKNASPVALAAPRAERPAKKVLGEADPDVLARIASVGKGKMLPIMDAPLAESFALAG